MIVTGVNAGLLAVATTFIGGQGGSQGASGAGTPQPGGDAVHGDAPAVLMAGSVLQFGFGGVSGGAPGSAADGPHRVTTDCRMAGALIGGATFIALLAAIRSPGDAVLGQPVTLDLTGAPGALALILFDREHGWRSIGGLQVPLLLGAGMVPLAAVTFGASGQSAYTLALPPDPLWRDEFAFFQGAVVSPPNSEVSLTNLGDLHLR